jgi:hypothetical protein
MLVEERWLDNALRSVSSMTLLRRRRGGSLRRVEPIGEKPADHDQRFSVPYKWPGDSTPNAALVSVLRTWN